MAVKPLPSVLINELSEILIILADIKLNVPVIEFLLSIRFICKIPNSLFMLGMIHYYSDAKIDFSKFNKLNSYIFFFTINFF